MAKTKGIFIDLNYKVQNNVTYIELIIKCDGIKERFLYQFDPYFYVECNKSESKTLNQLGVKSKTGELIKPKSIEDNIKFINGEKKNLFKIICYSPSDVPLLRSSIPFNCYESNILFVKRFILDLNLAPFSEIEFEHEGEIIKKIISVKEPKDLSLSKFSFDIETYNPLGTPRETIDPIIMISFCNDSSEVLTYKSIKSRKFVKSFKDEKETISAFFNGLSKYDPDIIYGYNSANFDIPYIQTRADKLGLKVEFGKWESNLGKLKKGLFSGIQLNGRIHLDLYPMMRFLGVLGILKSKRYTLEAVYNELGSGKKLMVERKDIWKMWDNNELELLADYSLKDAETTYELGNTVLDLFIELSKLSGLTLFETSLSTSGQMVEFLLMRESVRKEYIIPSKPRDSLISERLSNPIEGAFVKLPSPGIYENIAVMDFRGLYPSIIISYNIDPYTLTESSKEVHHSPAGWKFKKSPQGIIPAVLKNLVHERSKLKKEMKSLKKNSKEYNSVSARSQAYKIISNSFYGYLGYARSRWYNRNCAESVTAWGRKHIQDTIEKAEKYGFKVLYGDTDSVFLLVDKKSKKDVLDFLDSVNKSLPTDMELELEGFYPSGVFVGKKSEEKGAKKKYALLAEDGSIKIRGFELVRRDWSNIAKETQRKVLEIILKEKDKDKAGKVVRETIELLKSGKVDLKELVIYTQMTKDPSKYDIMSPEVSAAKKMIKKGVPVQKGSLIGYVVGKKGKSISEKAEPFEFAKDYDPDYYINNQLLPSVMKILKELGFSEDDLKFKGKQKGLDSFF
ncbi:MAG: DNA-directed DNA polymerase [Candidatus ainarchaeum sp.]|nr:DNA-directed DNA polymerase [Candidatus ainarchaeum sp.]